jgi:hydrogenase/urease accessory protein HupE
MAPVFNPARMSNGLSLLLIRVWRGIVMLLATAGGSAWAHNPDTSYARVRVTPNKLELRLTYDVFTLQKIDPGIDQDGDHALSRAELKAAAPVVQNFLRAYVGLKIHEASVDLGTAGEPFWPLDAPDPLPESQWHDQGALMSFPFDQALTAMPESVTLLADLFDVLGERHVVLGNFEAGGHARAVVLTVLEPEFRLSIRESHGSPLSAFLWQGVLHIWTGFDHLCFLLALLVVSRPRQIVAIVTAFTVAHSITLYLAARHLVEMPPRLIECAIAVTIIYVAVENFVRCRQGLALPNRWILTFVFGLVHGFGFANVLRELELPPDSMIPCLLMFNLGVELGQLAVVAALLPLVWWLSRWRYGLRIKLAISAAVAVLGLLWFTDRAFTLQMMPF